MSKVRVAVAALAVATFAAGAMAAAAASPEETVKSWLAAMKAHEFEKAYQYISKGMAGGKDVEAWSKEQKYIFETTDLKIFKYEVFPGKAEGETAKVPNILSSQDKFLNQLGADEYELYTLVKEDGQWKIDQQEIVEKGDQSKWFARKEG